MKVSLIRRDDGMARTIFYDRFLKTLRENPRFTEEASQAQVVFPAEDTALETNWPNFSNPTVRGPFDSTHYANYIRQLHAYDGPARLCVLDHAPSQHLSLIFQDRPHIIADVCLPSWVRSANPRAISTLAPPITIDTPSAVPRDILASFRGVVSHPCRQEIIRLHDGRHIVCKQVTRADYVEKVTADPRYIELLQRSVFGFVPRGDVLFSYRLAEVVSFGCIPVVISDGWVLPFDRTVDWTSIAVTVPENTVQEIPRILQQFSQARIAEMRTAVAALARRFATLDRIVESLLLEIEKVLQ